VVIKTVEILKRCINASVRAIGQAIATFHTRAASVRAGLAGAAVECFTVAPLDLRSFGVFRMVLSALMSAASAVNLEACSTNIIFIHYRSSFLCVLNSILCKERKKCHKKSKKKKRLAPFNIKKGHKPRA
jgi:hypothetical protein